MKKEDKDIRYYIDVDLENKKVINWNFGNRYELEQELKNKSHKRIFITKGQYNKLLEEI